MRLVIDSFWTAGRASARPAVRCELVTVDTGRPCWIRSSPSRWPTIRPALVREVGADAGGGRITGAPEAIAAPTGGECADRADGGSAVEFP